MSNNQNLIKMKKLTVICLTLLSVFFMASCRGPKGDPGNANVISTTITVYPDDWYKDNDLSWRVDINYKAISADITDHGAVLVYIDKGNTWRQLPYTFYYSQYNDNGDEVFYSSSLEVSSYDEYVSIFWTESDFYLGDDYRPETHRFKIVVIAASEYSARPDVDYSNYEAVKAAFQLAD
jgi:hypothetical protein